MKPQHTVLRLGPTLRFESPGGEELLAREPQLELTRVGDQLTRAMVTFRIDAEDWQRVDHGAWFHLDPAARGPTFSGGFDAGAEVEIEAALREESLPLLTIAAETVYQMAGQILAGPEELRRTESWYAHYVKQSRGPLKTGFSTRYSELAGFREP